MVVVNYVMLKQKDYLGLFRKARHNHKFLKGGGGEMTQRVKMLVVKPDNLSLILRTHMVEERTNPSKLSESIFLKLGLFFVYESLYICACTCVHRYTYIWIGAYAYLCICVYDA